MTRSHSHPKFSTWCNLQIHTEPSLDGCSLVSCTLFSPITFSTPYTCFTLARRPLVCRFYPSMGDTLDPTRSSVEYQQKIESFLVCVNTDCFNIYIYIFPSVHPIILLPWRDKGLVGMRKIK